MIVFLAALTALRLMIAAIVPLSPDEAYYWVWSRALAPGYLDHPPMVALWIRAGTWLAGPGPLGVRLLAPLAAALGSFLLMQAGADLLGERRAGVRAALLLNATLLFGVGAVTMTPDTPLLLFWTATLWALARLHATGRPEWWLVAGAAAGLALDSKYTAALLAPAIVFWLLAVPGLRPWLRRVHPWAAALMAGGLFLPVVAWNAAHGWASFARQGGRTGDWHPARALHFIGELVLGQIGLATPPLAVLFGAGMVLAARRGWRRDPAWTLLAAFTLLPAAVFVQHALGDRVQGNWPAIIYPAAALAASGLRWQRPAIALGFALTALVYAQAAFAPFPLPARFDPTLKQMGGWDGLARQVAAVAAQNHGGFVAVDNYGTAAELSRLLPPALPVIGLDARWALFALPPARPSAPGLLLRSVPEDAAQLTRARGGVVAERYRLYPMASLPADVPAVLLPRPED